MANLRRRGFLSVIYLDDILLFGRSYEECQSNTLSTRLLLGQLGFVINEKKCQLIPSRKCKFLGFLFDSERMIIELTHDKRDRVKREVEKYRAIKVCKIRRFAEFVGLVGSCCPAVMYGLGHTKLFEKARHLALESSKGSYDSCMTLDKDLQTDFKWWGKNIRHAHRSTRPPEFCREIFTDASLSGWGVACGQARSHGFWNEEERKSHINILELTTAFFGLKCFANDLRYCDILLRLDNTTAISYINRMGGVRFARLSNLARKIWDWCEERDIWIFASFISSKDNFEADFESRRLEPETELELSQTAFKRIVRTFGEPEVDLFATRVNKKCRKYISWLQDPNSIAVDAFTVPWKNYFFYAFPPFVIILRRTTSSLEKNYPGCRTVIRRSFAMRGIPVESMEIMIASLRDSSLKQYNSALKRWWNFCVERDTNPFRTSVEDVLVLLTKEYNNGASRGSLNCLRSAIALITGPEIGQDSRIRRLFKGVSELRPSKPKYEQTWDPRIVLRYISTLGSNEDMSLEVISKKLVTLLSLVTGHRMQTFSLIKLQNIERRQTSVQIKIPDKIKTSATNRKQPLLVLPFYEKDPTICAAATLKAYMSKTESLRNAEECLFIAFKKPHKAVSCQTLCRWTKSVLSKSGLDTQIFSAHSTRHASTSNANIKGVNIDCIRSTAGWTRNSQSFAQFYNLPIVNDNEAFARAILQ
ncbi:uncharacterized protein LOC124406221 [Diprion similis]|uniref:uncharacterized protein LOC124406221 n=1 Tax=Diprion similis TaxID=362088 RepID=UPI001EF8CD80|nr:uncharacterized protein LOC124406221 [Diprion similis]